MDEKFKPTITGALLSELKCPIAAYMILELIKNKLEENEWIDRMIESVQ